MQFNSLCLAATTILPLSSLAAVSYTASETNPPEIRREFRGLWIATVANIDWPSKRGLSTADQKAELISILDQAAALNLNAVLLQVRPACDALYASSIEPWSEYLTGTMGKPPEPYYDPLQFAIDEAHRRALELHAWFNPYRALHKLHQGTVAPNHISRKRPDLVKSYGQYLWLDPGERDVQDYSLSVVMDVVKRYDIDAVHFDDYFYPDRAESPSRAEFPDEASWKKFGAGGTLSREDWRRQNVNAFIQRVYMSIKTAKPWVKFGVSPHGIWRPGNPPQIRKGFDAYGTIYADSRKWLQSGWVDYFSPQLYWRIETSDQSLPPFPVLLEWWSQQNEKDRHLWPGLSAANALSQKWLPNEIPNQIRITRKQSRVDGYLIYSASQLLTNSVLTRTLKRDLLAGPALVPASPWLSRSVPEKPVASVSRTGTNYRFSWPQFGPGTVRWWVVQTKSFSDWKTEILPSTTRSRSFATPPEIFAVIAIDRFGNASDPCVLQAKTSPSPRPAARKHY